MRQANECSTSHARRGAGIPMLVATSVVPMLAAMAVGMSPGEVHAQSRAAEAYPNRPIRMIVDFSAGGLSDQLVRAVAPKMSDALGQPMVMDNRPGAAGALAYSIVAKAVPDGHTLVTLSTGFSLNLNLVSKLPFDTDRDFIPIGLIGTTPNVLVTSSKGAKTVADQKKTLSDQDLEALVGDRLYSATETWELLDLVVTSASKVRIAS